MVRNLANYVNDGCSEFGFVAKDKKHAGVISESYT